MVSYGITNKHLADLDFADDIFLIAQKFKSRLSMLVKPGNLLQVFQRS